MMRDFFETIWNGLKRAVMFVVDVLLFIPRVIFRGIKSFFVDEEMANSKEFVDAGPDEPQKKPEAKTSTIAAAEEPKKAKDIVEVDMRKTPHRNFTTEESKKAKDIVEVDMRKTPHRNFTTEESLAMLKKNTDQEIIKEQEKTEEEITKFIEKLKSIDKPAEKTVDEAAVAEEPVAKDESKPADPEKEEAEEPVAKDESKPADPEKEEVVDAQVISTDNSVIDNVQVSIKESAEQAKEKVTLPKEERDLNTKMSNAINNLRNDMLNGYKGYFSAHSREFAEAFLGVVAFKTGFSEYEKTDHFYYDVISALQNDKLVVKIRDGRTQELSIDDELAKMLRNSIDNIPIFFDYDMGTIFERYEECFINFIKGVYDIVQNGDATSTAA